MGCCVDLNSIVTFLNGTDFENGLRVYFKSDRKHVFNRIEFLNQKVSGKSVLHIGCADHPEVVERKMANSEWLHGVLSANATTCLGVDLNQVAINELAIRHGVKNILNWNILEEPVPVEIESSHWDYVILGEVLEHIDNPVKFLTVLDDKINSIASAVIITVPNAWQYLNWKKALKGIEVINSDHRYWFTPYTICKVATCAGLSLQSLTLCEYHDWKKRGCTCFFSKIEKNIKAVFFENVPPFTSMHSY
jgi:hypothetical protein